MPTVPDDLSQASTARSPASPLRRLEAVLRTRSQSLRAQRIVLSIALVTFVLVAALAYRGLPNDLDIRWWLLPFLVLGLIPLVLLANAAEYRAIARVVGHAPRWSASLRLTVIASAANLLPLPGAFLLRAQALRMAGATYRSAFGANVAAAVLWVGCGAAAIAFLSLRASASGWIVASLLGVALAALAGGSLMVQRMASEQSMRCTLDLLVVEMATVVLSAARLYVTFRVLGLTGTATEAVALSSSIIVAAAIGVFPAGLGIRELLAAAIGVVLSLDASVAVTVVAVDRVCGIVTTALATGAVLLFDRALRESRGEDGPG